MGRVQELSGASVKGYLLEDCLGWTSHSAVYRATGPGGAEWAVKVVDSRLEPDPAFWERLRREALLLANVGHPDILPIHESGRDDSLTFAATPLVRAPTLRDLMGRGRLDNELVWRILSQIADALDSAHYRGLVFRLLKPANILVDESHRVYLAEFGVASRRVGPLALSTPRYHLTAPEYLAPEQVEGKEPDWRADIYAMAVLVFELLTRTPLRAAGPLSETLRATLGAPVPSAHAREPSLPPAVDRVLFRAMAKDPRKRHNSAAELLEDLVALPDEQTVSGPPAEVHGTSPLAPKAPLTDDMVVMRLKRMGVPVLQGRQRFILNSYFAALLRHAKEVCEERWPEVLLAAGLLRYLEEEPPDDGERSATVESASRLADGVATAFGPGAPEVLRQWGRLTAEAWIRSSQQLQDGSVTYMRPFRILGRAEQRVEDTLYVFCRNLDRIRGERLTAWKRVDRRQFWLVQYDNLLAVGRRRPARFCTFWTAALEAALRWGGMANEWIVEEAECGCVTGTYDCVFTIQNIKR